MKYTNIELESKNDPNGGWCSISNEVVNREKNAALINDWIAENNTTDVDSKNDNLLEKIIDRDNLNCAYQRVYANKGSAGVDGMEVEKLLHHLKTIKGSLIQSIIDGKYKPSPVLRVEIPKENGKKRMLGIPTVTDRVIQQAIAQTLTPIYEPKFVETSYGFRPHRSAHDAIRKCLEYLNDGYEYTVDMDLEKFFDTVNQSKLVQILYNEVKDGRVISLINKFLRAGVVINGKFEKTTIGVPQGGPLSPLLANIMLNELDHELERRGHKFVRYADDMVIFCKSKASAKQTLEHIIPYIEKKLFLKVNREKTVVAYANNIKFLGYGFYKGKGGFRCRLHEKTKAKLKDSVRELTDRRHTYRKDIWTQDIKSFVVGWCNYFYLADMGNYLKKLDKWMRRRIRMVFWKRWKRVRTRYRNLRKLGIKHELAFMTASCRKLYWGMANSNTLKAALNISRLRYDGFVNFSDTYLTIRMAKQR